MCLNSFPYRLNIGCFLVAAAQEERCPDAEQCKVKSCAIQDSSLVNTFATRDGGGANPSTHTLRKSRGVRVCLGCLVAGDTNVVATGGVSLHGTWDKPVVLIPWDIN